MSVAGTYDTVVKSPMGEQKGTFTVVPGDDGNTFTGSMAGGMGSMDVKDGKKRSSSRKILPGYILVEMDLPESDWKATCSGIRKMVEYDVTPGRYLVQIVNAPQLSIRAMAVLRD
mgnify:CR=1 FL=1